MKVKNTGFDTVVSYLSSNLAKRLVNIPDNIKDNLQEIRLRLNRPIALNCPFDTYYITENGCVTNTLLNQPMLTASARDISETFGNICNYSVYSRQNEIKNGFVTISGGHRAGICGTAVVDNGKIINIRDISSINIRICVEHTDCCRSILKMIKDIQGGVLLCGAPCSGKTTILRDMARVLSTEYKMKIALIDERSEIAGTCKGVFQKNIGMCDVLDGYSKFDGFSHALRCLSPDIIICDELGTGDDIQSIENAMHSGTSLIASVHCASLDELVCKPQLKSIIELRAFKTIVLLSNRENVGQVSRLSTINELLS